MENLFFKGEFEGENRNYSYKVEQYEDLVLVMFGALNSFGVNWESRSGAVLKDLKEIIGRKPISLVRDYDGERFHTSYYRDAIYSEDDKVLDSMSELELAHDFNAFLNYLIGVLENLENRRKND